MHTHEEDDALLEVFKQLGVDLQKPRELIFYFLFSTELDTDNASRSLDQKTIASEKFKVDPPWWKRLFAKPRWALSVTRTMPLDESKIKQTTSAFQEVASTHNGQYDGWEANVMDDHIDAAQVTDFRK